MAPSMTELKRNTRLKKPRFTTLWIRGLVIQHLEGGERAEGYAVPWHRGTGWEGLREAQKCGASPAPREGGAPWHSDPEKPQAMVQVQPADFTCDQSPGDPSAITYMVALVDLPSMDS